MKKILLFISYLALTNCYAENWLNHSKILNASKEAYSLKSDCERISGEKCFDLGNNPSSVFSEIDVEVDDTLKPNYSKSETESCLSFDDCDSKFAVKSCLDNQESPIKNYDLLQVYCSKFTGYDKKLEKSIGLDSVKVSALNAQKAIDAQAATKEAGIQFALKRIECGKRVIGLLVLRNSTKTLTTANVAQINTVYAPIKGLIDTGSLITAKEQMNLIVPDGTLITQEDKDELVQEITKCL